MAHNSDVADTTHDMTWHANSSIFILLFGLVGPNPGSELIFQNKSLHYWPFRHQPTEHGLKYHPKQYGGMLEPSFCTHRLL